MTDDLVTRLRDSSRYDSQLLMREAAADRIEQLETLVSYLAGTNECHVRVMLKGNPIVCDEIISKARAALEKKHD